MLDGLIKDLQAWKSIYCLRMKFSEGRGGTNSRSEEDKEHSGELLQHLSREGGCPVTVALLGGPRQGWGGVT